MMISPSATSILYLAVFGDKGMNLKLPIQNKQTDFDLHTKKLTHGIIVITF